MKPPVIPWFTAYAICMALLYLLISAGGIFLMFLPQIFPDIEMDDSEALETSIMAIVMTVICLPLAIAYAVGAFLPPSPWVWIYNIVLIGIGLSGCPTLFAAIPLLIFWLKPETKAYYGR